MFLIDLSHQSLKQVVAQDFSMLSLYSSRMPPVDSTDFHNALPILGLNDSFFPETIYIYNGLEDEMNIFIKLSIYLEMTFNSLPLDFIYLLKNACFFYSLPAPHNYNK